MKRIFSTAACLIILAQALVVLPQKPINHGGKIESRYDGVAFETVLRLRKMKVDCGGFKDNFKDGCVSIDVALHCPGTQVSHVGSVTLQVIFDTKSWDQSHAPNQRELSVIADAETVSLGRMRLVPRGDTVMQETMTETLEATLPYDVFKKIAQAQSIELQVGPSTVTLKEKNLAALRDLNSRVIR
jgi:hypothetical protein